MAQACDIKESLSKADVDENELLIAVVRINNRPIVESIDLYKHKNTYLMPVSQLGFLFNLDWAYNQEKYIFYSKYSDAKHDFCDFTARLIHKQSDNEFVWYDDGFEVFVDANYIATLLQGEIEFNPELQQLNFTSTYEKIGYAQTQSANIIPSYNEVEIVDFPIVRGQYKSFTSPIINYNTSINDSATGDFGYQTSINAYFDLLGRASEFRYTKNKQTTREYLKFSRNILMSQGSETQLGNIQNIEDRAIKYEFGDIQLIGDELLSPSRQVIGAKVFSFSQNQRRNFSNVRIEETALPGWRAILFRNGLFVAEQVVDEDGLIKFEEVATFFGVNAFRMHLYGPQGQEEFREKVIHVGNSQQKANEYDFSFSASDSSKTLFHDKGTNTPFDKQFSAAFSYGITDKLTINNEWVEMFNNNKTDRFLTTAIDYANYNSLFRAKYAHNNAGGGAFFAGINTNIGKHINGNLNFRYFDEFDSELYKGEIGLQQQIQMRLLSRITAPFKMGVNFSFTEKKYKDRAIQRSLSVQTNQNLMSGTFSNNLSAVQRNGEKVLTHDLFLTTSISAWQLRQSLSWEPLEGGGLSKYSANLRWPHTGRFFNETRMNYTKNSHAQYKLSHRFNWQADNFNLQLATSIDNKENWQVKLSVTGSFYKSKQTGKYEFTKSKGNNSRRIEAIAFIDKDGDGQQSEEEDRLQEIVFAGRANWKTKKSSKNGIAELFTRADYQTISIDETSLEDPFLATEQPTKIISTHAGSSTKVYFPMTPVSDIEGSVLIENDKETAGILGLSLQLVNEAQDAFYFALTESSGYFYFQKIPPGTYTLAVDNQQLKRLNLDDFAPITIRAPEIGDIVTLKDITLKTNKDEAQSNLETASKIKTINSEITDDLEKQDSS